MFDRIKVEVGRYIVSSCCVHTVFEPSENTTMILYSLVPLIFRILSHVYQVTTPIHSLYCNIIHFWAESRAHRFITNRQIFCLFVCLFAYFTAVTLNTANRKLTTVSLIVTYYGVNIIYVCIVASTTKQVRCRQVFIIIYMQDS